MALPCKYVKRKAGDEDNYVGIWYAGKRLFLLIRCDRLRLLPPGLASLEGKPGGARPGFPLKENQEEPGLASLKGKTGGVKVRLVCLSLFSFIFLLKLPVSPSPLPDPLPPRVKAQGWLGS